MGGDLVTGSQLTRRAPVRRGPACCFCCPIHGNICYGQRHRLPTAAASPIDSPSWRRRPSKKRAVWRPEKLVFLVQQKERRREVKRRGRLVRLPILAVLQVASGAWSCVHMAGPLTVSFFVFLSHASLDVHCTRLRCTVDGIDDAGRYGCPQSKSSPGQLTLHGPMVKGNEENPGPSFALSILGLGLQFRPSVCRSPVRIVRACVHACVCSSCSFPYRPSAAAPGQISVWC